MEKRDGIILMAKPKLRNPYLVCGMSGWVDGGEAATGTVKYLSRKLHAIKFASMPIARFHIYQIPGEPLLRPEVKIEDGLLKKHIMPANEFFYALNAAPNSDLILFKGSEPHINWEDYAAGILNLAEEFGVRRVFFLGGVLDTIPHTREPMVSCICSSLKLRNEIAPFETQFTSYEGPGSFGTFLMYTSQNRGMEMVSLMVRATYYPEFSVVIPRNPKSIRATVKRLNAMMHLSVDLSDLDTESRDFEGKLDFMAGQNPEMRAYVEGLEKDYIERNPEESLQITGDEAVRLAEELLKQRDDE